jgi:hypothetical protein
MHSVKGNSEIHAHMYSDDIHTDMYTGMFWHTYSHTLTCILICTLQESHLDMSRFKTPGWWLVLGSDLPFIYWLVGGLEPWNFMTFHSVGNGIIIPTDENIFQRARAQPPTSWGFEEIQERGNLQKGPERGHLSFSRPWRLDSWVALIARKGAGRWTDGPSSWCPSSWDCAFHSSSYSMYMTSGYNI